MKKHIWIYGTIAGLINLPWMLTVASLDADIHFENGEIYGYTSMILAFSMIFVGVKNYRDKYQDGVITFGKAFKLGFFIALVASTVYVIIWLIEFYFFVPDFLDKYASFYIEKLRADGLSPEKLTAKIAEMDQMKEWYKNPFF